MIAGIPDWAEASTTVYAEGEAFGGLGKAGLITIIIIAVIAIVTLVWIFRETRKRD
jgi:lipoprotein signal peptidase